MLAIENYLKKIGANSVYPRPDKSGFFGYSFLGENKVLQYEFFYYKWENTKAHPSYYTIKNYELIQLNNGSYFLDSKLKYVNWDIFFIEMKLLKERILKNKIHKIPKNKYENEDLLWQSFLKTQDTQLAAVIKNLPDIFYETIDEQKTTYQRYDARIKFFEYMKHNIYGSFFAWKHFVPEDFHNNFCNWFHTYLIDV
jgi:hypothetical protein